MAWAWAVVHHWGPCLPLTRPWKSPTRKLAARAEGLGFFGWWSTADSSTVESTNLWGIYWEKNNIYIYIYIYNIDTYMYMYIYIYIYLIYVIYVYVYMYTCIYAYTYMCIYIYMHTSFYRYDISGILSATPRWDPVKPVLFATKPGSSAAQVFSRPQKDREVTSHLKEPLFVLLSKGFF